MVSCTLVMVPSRTLFLLSLTDKKHRRPGQEVKKCNNLTRYFPLKCAPVAKIRKISLTNGTSDCGSMLSFVARPQTSLPSPRGHNPFYILFSHRSCDNVPLGLERKSSAYCPSICLLLLHRMIPQSIVKFT